MRTSRIELQEVAIRALPTRTDGKHLAMESNGKCHLRSAELSDTLGW
jgi:hypothetical protein